jgi:hypothetical protein
MSSSRLANVGTIYGNGNVYIVERKGVTKVNEYNFKMRSLDRKPGGDYTAYDELFVILGSQVSTQEAIKYLLDVIKTIEFETPGL